MDDLLAGLNLIQPPALVQLVCFMDGGSVHLSLLDDNSTAFSVQFCQTMSLEQQYSGWTPGSLLLNDCEVALRSTTETLILDALKHVNLANLTALEQQIVQERIAFVESDEYLRIAALLGRVQS